MTVSELQTQLRSDPVAGLSPMTEYRNRFPAFPGAPVYYCDQFFSSFKNKHGIDLEPLILSFIKQHHPELLI